MIIVSSFEMLLQAFREESGLTVRDLLLLDHDSSLFSFSHSFLMSWVIIQLQYESPCFSYFL